MSVTTLFNILSKSEEPGLLLVARITRLSIKSPSFVLDVLDGIRSKEARMSMYCADAIETISRTHAVLLAGYETEIITHLAVSTRAEVRAPLARVVPRLTLDPPMKKRAIDVMFEYLKDDSGIVRERVYNALAEVGLGDARVVEKIVPLLRERLEVSDLSERIRAKKLLSVLSPGETLMNTTSSNSS